MLKAFLSGIPSAAFLLTGLFCLTPTVLAQGPPRILSSSFTPAPGAAVRKVAALNAALVQGDSYIVEDASDLGDWLQISPILKGGSGPMAWAHTQPAMAAFFSVPSINGATWASRRFYRIRQVAAEGTPAGPPPSRGLMAEAPGAFKLITAAGWTLKMACTTASIPNTTITLTCPSGKDTYQAWGDGSIHENLNGKHLKDWFSPVARTVIIPGDTMITMTRGLKSGSSLSILRIISIYDGMQSHRINLDTGVVLLSVNVARSGELAEPDGETCRFRDTGAGAYLENLYTQDAATNGQPVPQEAVPLGTTGGPANPTQVNDLVDDPRLGHT